MSPLETFRAIEGGPTLGRTVPPAAGLVSSVDVENRSEKPRLLQPDSECCHFGTARVVSSEQTDGSGG